MEHVAGGHKPGRSSMSHSDDRHCVANPEGSHNWVMYAHEEEEWFGWLKKGGLWSDGYDCYRCTHCGQTKKIHV